MPDGYGVTWASERLMRAHRVAYALVEGPIPEGLEVLHRCDNPPCCNPAHLFIGTKSDNMRDMAAKGRQVMQARPERRTYGQRTNPPRGEAHYRAKLTDSQVAEIRDRRSGGEGLRLIAERFGISVAHVHRLVTGQSRRG